MRWAQRVWKRQPGGGLAGTRQVALEQRVVADALQARIGQRDRLQQAARVRMPRLGVQSLRVGDLHDPAEIHDGDAVAHALHDARSWEMKR